MSLSQEEQAGLEAELPVPLTVGSLRFIGKLVASRQQVTVRPGSRLTVQCVLGMPPEKEWDADDLPEEWRSAWQILGTATGGQLGSVVDLEAPEVTSAAGFRPRTRLLLDTDYGGGPLWYRSVDNMAPWGLGLDHSRSARRCAIDWSGGRPGTATSTTTTRTTTRSTRRRGTTKASLCSC